MDANNVPGGSSNSNIEQPYELNQLESEKYPFSDGKYFKIDMEKTSLEGSLVGICQLCRSYQTIKKTFRSLSNFTTHIKRKHKDEYDAFLSYKKRKIETPQLRNQQFEATCTFSQEKFEENVTNFIIESMAPFECVELPSFRKIFDDFKIKQNTKTLKHMSRIAVCRRMELLYKEKMLQIRTSLEKEATYVCTTADMWISRSRRLLGVTVHWIHKDNFSRNSAAIACRRFSGTHSLDKIADILMEINASFGFNGEKLVATVTDNGANLIKAFREFGANILESFLSEENSIIDDDESSELLPITGTGVSNDEEAAAGNDPTIYDNTNSFERSLPKHLRCASHTLNLVAAVDTVKIIKSSEYLSSNHFGVLEKCTILWNALCLPKSYEIVKVHLGVALSRPVANRWTSLYDALNRIISFQQKIVAVSPLIGITSVLTEDDFRYIHEYLRILKPLAETIDILQGESYSYYGYLLPSLVSLRRKLSSMLNSNAEPNTPFSPLINGIITSLNDRFEKFFRVEDEVAGAAIAAVSHPRFKLRWVASFPDDIQQRVKDLFLKAAREVYQKKVQNVPHIKVPDQQPSDDFFDFGNDDATSIESRFVGIEIVKYMANPNTELAMLKEFPILREVFIKFNTPLPSSAAVERLFSYTSMMNLPKWNGLSDKHFEQRILLKANVAKA